MKNAGSALRVAVLIVGLLILAALCFSIVMGLHRADGKSAYELAVEDGFQGSLHDWLVSLAIKGNDGADGSDGKNGSAGASGSDGVGIRDVRVNAAGHLIVTLDNGKTLDAGMVGTDGSLPSATVDADGFLEVYETVRMNDEASLLNLREQPDTTSKILETIPSGTEILRVGVNETTGWSRLIRDGQFCYAKNKYFEPKYVYEGELPEVHLPPSVVLTVGAEAWFRSDEIMEPRDGFSLSFSYSGAGNRVYDGKAGFAITPEWTTVSAATPHPAEEAVLTVTLHKDGEKNGAELASYSVRVTVVDAQKGLAMTGILIGDSRISDGTVAKALASDLPNLTLLGTRETAGGVRHEGRGSWSTANYLKSESAAVSGVTLQNPFRNPASGQFDFSYYMEQNYPTVCPDFVLFRLGANDGFTRSSVENLEAMVASVQAYAVSKGRTVRVLILHEYLSPSEGYYLSGKTETNVAAMRTKQFRYFTYLTEAFGGKEPEGVYLLPVHLGINNWSDRIRATVATGDGNAERVTDVIHLGTSGYRKEAAMIEANLFSLFGE